MVENNKTSGTEWVMNTDRILLSLSYPALYPSIHVPFSQTGSQTLWYELPKWETRKEAKITFYTTHLWRWLVAMWPPWEDCDGANSQDATQSQQQHCSNNWRLLQLYHGKQPRTHTERPKDHIIKTQVCCCEVLVYLFLKLKH